MAGRGEEEEGRGDARGGAELRPRVGAGAGLRDSVALRARKACCSALRPLAAGAADAAGAAGAAGAGL